MMNLSMADPEHNLRPRLMVMGIGGAGGNAINNMIRCNLEGCEFIGANTDSQALAMSLAPRKIQLGVNMSRGLGAGSKPEMGRAAAEEQLADIMSCLEGADMVFLTAGMGGGTGTGAAPVIARAARESGILTVGVVTKPFHFEGAHRMRQAEQGISELQQYVDTLIVIPNQNLFRIANERTTFAEAFRMADEVLHCGVRGITDLMVMPGFMNLDFADVRTVMGEMGKAMMGTGEAEGENRAIRAAEAAISNPLLDDVSMKGARGVLINITGGMDMTLFEVDQAANRIREEVDPEAQIKVGSTLGEDLDGRIRVSVIATGIDVAVVPVQRAASGGASAVRPRAGVESVAQRAAPSMPQQATMQEAAHKPSFVPSPMSQAPTTSIPPSFRPSAPSSASTASSAAAAAQAPSPQVMTPSVNARTPYFTMPPVTTPQEQEVPSLRPAMEAMQAVQEKAEEPQSRMLREPEFHEEQEKQIATAGATASLGASSAAIARTMQSPSRISTEIAPGVSESSSTSSSPASSARSAFGPSARPSPLATPSQPSPIPPPPTRLPSMGPSNPPAAYSGASAASGAASPSHSGYDLRLSPVPPQGSQGSGAEQRRMRRSESLFTRITGFGLVRPSARKDDLEDEDAHPGVRDKGMAKDSGGAMNAASLDHAPASSDQSSSDILDIPAFLRRQTNH